MNKIDTLIAYLFAIQAFAKDIHYSASGKAFYSKHLLADEIYKGIDEQIDALIETCILPLGEAKHIISYWKGAETLFNNKKVDLKEDFWGLKHLIEECLDELKTYNAISRGAQSIYDNIAQDLQRKLGLITRQVG